MTEPTATTAQAEPLPSDVDAIEALAYVMACLSGVIHPDLMDRLGTVWQYVHPKHSDGPNPPSASAGGSGRGGEEAVPRFSDPAPACDQFDGSGGDDGS